MRAYSESSEEALFARRLLKEWAGERLLTDEQYRRMEQDTVCELRRTNVFLRIVLFLFTLLIVGAATSLWFIVISPDPSPRAGGVFLLIFGGVCYAAAEMAVARAHLYRHGIEEALAVCAVGLLCAGIYFALFNGSDSLMPHGAEFLVPTAGASASLWIWHRFGLPYAFLAAMIFVLWLPGYWTHSHTMQHLMVAAFYAAALFIVVAVRARHRFDYLNERYATAEALLWFGIYLAIDIQISSTGPGQLWGGVRTVSEYSRPFYWATWALTWCLPVAVLSRGLRRKDRYAIAVGGVVSVLTLATNRLYFGWELHSWDPIILGGLMVGTALFVHRWISAGAGGIRGGFVARRLSGRDKDWMSAGSVALGLVGPDLAMPGPPKSGSEVRFGGGESGGGGASSDF